VVKLDRTLVDGLDRKPRQRKLVSATVRLCHELGALVVAEGIETTDEYLAVCDSGADFGQGYLFARPAFPLPPVVWPRPGSGKRPSARPRAATHRATLFGSSMQPVAKAQLRIHVCVVLWGFTPILGKVITLPAAALVLWRMSLVAGTLSLLPRVWRGWSHDCSSPMPSRERWFRFTG
jgi:hypothetical protein